MRVLCVAAHPDDEVLGCGGTMARLASEGADVHVLLMSEGRSYTPDRYSDAAKAIGARVPAVYTLPDNAFDTAGQADVCGLAEAHMRLVRPHLVLTHSPNDLNVDHRMTSEAVLVATRTSMARVLAFEVPSSTEWAYGLGGFDPRVFYRIDVDAKLRALECYESEMRESPHPRSYAGVRALSMWRGHQAGVDTAEAFVLLREVV